MKKIYSVLSLVLFFGYLANAQETLPRLQFSPSSDGAKAAVLDPTTGVKEFNQSSIFVYSFNNVVFVDCSEVSNKKGIIEVYSLTGRKLVQQPIQNKSLNRVSLSNISIGYYIVKVFENGNITTKIVYMR